MKILLQTFFFILAYTAIAQNSDLERSVLVLKQKISESEKGEKLKWMDSLSLLIDFNDEYNYDSIVRQTIKYALELDSLDIATRNTHDLVYYKTAIIGKPEEGLKIFKDFTSTEKRLISNAAKARLYIQGASSYHAIGDIDEAIKQLEVAKKLALKTTNAKLLADINLSLGKYHGEIGDFVKSSNFIQEAIPTFIEKKDTVKIIDSKNVLSILYSQNAFYKEAELERNEAIALAKKQKEESSLYFLYFNAAQDYRLLGDHKKWIANMKLCLKANEKSLYKIHFEPLILCNLIIALAESNNLKEAEEYFKTVENNLEKYSTGNNYNTYIETLKQMAFAKGNYQEAVSYGKEHLDSVLKLDAFVEIMNAENFMAKVYNAQKDAKNSLKHKVRYYTIKDSVATVQKVKALTFYQTLYETEKRDLKIEAQESSIALLDSKNKIKNQWMLFGGLGLLLIFWIIFLIWSRKEAQKRHQRQEQFTTQLVNIQEVERSRVARELHDSVGQKLLVLKNILSQKEKDQQKEIDVLDETITEVREMSHSLHPFQFEKLGLVQSLEDMITAFQKNSEVFYSSEIEDISGLIPKEKEIILFRMLQECIGNVEKHAEATACNLSVKQKKENVVFCLKDNGKGFDVEKSSEKVDGLGMKTLKERAKYIDAMLRIDSEKEKGTTITIKISKA
ncbi:tetratricopeptide repeat-containing sensor histidine kinase [Aquimarina pacifica]|uniref:tetratricopeptide repeat-containing sensor histidine kinase n=1 Tax=Aquimarina pacifica TaxID=1296415 RepID=UPI00046EDBC6|nr:sensor histidine kinase [Aquimarina pacifica]